MKILFCLLCMLNWRRIEELFIQFRELDCTFLTFKDLLRFKSVLEIVFCPLIALCSESALNVAIADGDIDGQANGRIRAWTRIWRHLLYSMFRTIFFGNCAQRNIRSLRFMTEAFEPWMKHRLRLQRPRFSKVLQRYRLQ